MYTHTKESQASLSPVDALQILKEGNQRFCGNLKANRNLLQQVNETNDGQLPFATILEFVEAVSNENVRQAVNAISERSEVLAGMQASGAINIVGAMYDVSDGSVAFFDDPS